MAKRSSINRTTGKGKSVKKASVSKKAVSEVLSRGEVPKNEAHANTANSGLDAVFITELDRYLFGQGRNYKIYQKMGAHPATLNGKTGMHFAVWAPHAKAVSIVSDRNNWDVTANYMLPLEDSGIYEGFIEGMGYGEIYKFAIHTMRGEVLYKADPYGFSAEFRPGTASKTADVANYGWSDGEWMRKRAKDSPFAQPIAIYECHIGSWRKKDREEKNGFYTYVEAAHELAQYCNDMGYTHVELMGIAEHPLDASWGYQVTGYYAPTSRYGTPKEFMYMVDYLHKHGIGVILDWVPAHFPKDAQGLADFDGTATYEYADPRMGEHPDWGTKIFDYSKNEVKNFLIGNALYWYDEYHIDGLRVDAVASMLYLDYGRENGQWIPNKYGGNGNLDAIEFFKHLNSVIRGRKDGTMIIAEESTAWPKVTAAPEEEGLGFTYKWNMGWMHDFLDYMKLDPLFRKGAHNMMTFGMSYATAEKFILVISHDEVVHLKCSMINKMPGIYEDKFRNLKCGYLFMFGHAGKKLLFMGQDFAQLHEWNEAVALDWYLIEEPWHKNVHGFVRDLLHMYRKYPAMWELDDSWDGFEWVNADDSDRSIFSFIRKDKTGKDNLLFVINMTPMERPDYRVGVPVKTRYTLLLNEDGNVDSNKMKTLYQAESGECDGKPYNIAYSLPAYGCAVFRFSY
ncbi:1,4-alpha-glucan branching protein GlgB [Oribacterium sp. WCC10]|uniref:1,4-alpha-glucan branching protein GlgB n=1 Tax=Oribacterium sp. WCC10 TaxID=1855343 RepID=UPI0008EB019B|nr:1,4-alpha-glucan branching protein GlgB [Oribacterium sp. WCC10]SFG33850.1 1,4-alpha-glucan branching enzyme [Oribacterium sp. WCC10]